MRIDHTHRKWLIASVVILAASAAAYFADRLASTKAWSGGSALGLTLGILGSAFMLFAALLGAKKKVPVWRLGRAQTWMRGHLWLGLLSLPLILFHGGFECGGTLTTVLMWLLIATVASGVIGAALQHYMPRTMTAQVPMETIYDEIDHVRAQLREEADRLVEAVCGPLGFTSLQVEEGILRAGGASALQTAPGTAALAVALSEEETGSLRRFYLDEMRPFLESRTAGKHSLSDTASAGAAFEQLGTLLPVAAHEMLSDLANICEEERQLRRQARLHHWLHGWLLVHIPLSLALIVLGAVHAWMALRF